MIFWFVEGRRRRRRKRSREGGGGGNDWAEGLVFGRSLADNRKKPDELCANYRPRFSCENMSIQRATSVCECLLATRFFFFFPSLVKINDICELLVCQSTGIIFYESSGLVCNSVTLVEMKMKRLQFSSSDKWIRNQSQDWKKGYIISPREVKNFY